MGLYLLKYFSREVLSNELASVGCLKDKRVRKHLSVVVVWLLSRV